MNGFVDDQLRALLSVPVSASREGNRTEILAWIDTAFNGGLALPRKLVADLGLVEVSYVEAILADGKSVELPLFRCIIDWFGNCYETEIAASDGKLALLGTALLADRDLHILFSVWSVRSWNLRSRAAATAELLGQYRRVSPDFVVAHAGGVMGLGPVAASAV